MFSRSFAISLSACALAVCVSSSVSATEKKDWYLGASVGYAKSTLSDAYFPTGSVEKTNQAGFKLYGGYQFNRNWAAELEYVNFGKYSADSANLHSTAKASGLGLSAVGVLPLSEQFSLFGKAGVLAKMVKADERNNSGSYIYSQKSTKFAPLLGFGAEYRLTPEMSVRAEYEYAGKTRVGENDAKLTNNLLSVGVRYQF